MKTTPPEEKQEEPKSQKLTIEELDQVVGGGELIGFFTGLFTIGSTGGLSLLKK